MSQLEAKVDSAVASHGAPALRDAPEGAAAAHAPAGQAGAEPMVESAPSLAPSVRSDTMEEIDVAASAHAQQRDSRASASGSGGGG
jgi:hypothetical protein